LKLALVAGAVVFLPSFAGEFICKTGPDRDSDFFYAAIQYTF
jgi:hypothetical protein